MLPPVSSQVLQGFIAQEWGRNRLAIGFAAACVLAFGAFATIGNADGSSRNAPTLASLVADEALVARGAYLATAANCVSCHTAEAGEAFAGGLAFRTDFGVIHSTNITPDIETGIGNWTYADFERSMRKGVGDGGEHLYPVFPYASFTRITDEDLQALFAYFGSLEPVSSPPVENSLRFPYNQRWLLGGWKMLFLDEGPFVPAPDQPEEWNRGAYLVDALAHCAACHSPRNALGAKKAGEELSGGIYIDRVPSGDYRAWAAPNLTPASSGLETWTAEDIADYLRVGKNRHAATFGPMNEVIGNSTQHLSPDDLGAMAVYLKSLAPRERPARASLAGTAAEKLGRGQTLYNIHCGTCHQPTGLGAPETGARLAGSPVVQAEDPASLLNVIIYGPELPDPWPPIGDWKQMPSFNDKLKDEEIAALASYVRQEWGHRASEVTVEDVAAQRPPFDTAFKGVGE